MIIQGLAFYMFAAITVAAAVLVISARNPVHSVLFLILAFFNSAGLFVLLGAEFLAMILVVVYVGAVAVLFMFVVMMLDISLTEMREGFLQYLPLGALVGFILLMELGVIVGGWAITPDVDKHFVAPAIAMKTTNTEALGNMLYTHYVYYFQAAGMILLVAMIGAIVLTHRSRPGVRKQNIGDQVARHPSDTIEIKKVSSGSGI
ncbi:MAG: NADH-quinone oxidoreductase subunit J [Rhodospirillaceae bacterium]|mgnify:FL=1|jgi:NADH-quinone oxidoreductase subunit J|nr:NADH-quinone oxidoreductase subunit J [Rhodospirillaceae bacterium]MBT4589301.1 NADH-quinone oxidoreductase subunit J [Rhodospirillaceae bacterium]MBT7267176.1 NADH-quinone oxidoreductase subunit J [Rhodospirillaceae bacterium]